MAEQSRHDQLVSNSAIQQAPRVTSAASPVSAIKEWADKHRRTDLEMEGQIELVKPEDQVLPLLRIGPVDFRVGLAMKLKLPLRKVKAAKNKITIKGGAVEIERDISFDGGMFGGLIKEVKLLSEIKWASDGPLLERAKRPLWAKLIGIELSFDGTVILEWLKYMAKQEQLTLIALRARKGVPNPEKLRPEDTKWLPFTLAYRALNSLYKKSEAKRAALQGKYGRDGQPIELDPKTEVSLNFDPGLLLSQPERILSSEIALKSPDLSLFQIYQLAFADFVSTGDSVEDAKLQSMVFSLEAALVVNLNTAGWASLGGAGAWGGVLYMARETVARAVPVITRTATVMAPKVLAASAALAGAATNATLGLIVIGIPHFTGDNAAIGYAFGKGYARTLAYVVGCKEAELKSMLAQYADADWRTSLAEYIRVVRKEGGESLMMSAQALESLIPMCGRAAVLEQIRGLRACDGGAALWDSVKQLHMARAGVGESERVQYYLRKLYAQVDVGDPSQTVGIALLAP